MDDIETNWDQAFTVDFDLINGLSGTKNSTKRKLSQMKNMFSDTGACKAVLEKDDPVIYEFYELGAPENSGDLAFGTSITYPGKVGNEYYMTKGHFHSILETAEVYYCLSGQGYMLLENPEGDWKLEELTPGKAVYVPQRYAHRSINTGKEPFITFFTFRADAGHDYKTIETKGYRKIVVEENGVPVVRDNPKWD
ncbi:glucose-6-phosphate isomerase [Ruminiclostridium cellobioparum]|uniref:Glucose-6-phosphate isomerase n=1 Tax=Ruminiclostridium cellobioparum subsp. termitidis CT1112 TaxID=1195236 RepID=S0FQ48_RUMCE|nr:glucose-6-phosphate isomerase [Ruminiclostridium cellobioparum]EMS72476.1 glucose-6-phosphate isomerase [Ruminiclostridium cellobioparum subsp. termitidis CT1112]